MWKLYNTTIMFEDGARTMKTKKLSVQTVNIVNSLPKVDFGVESTVSNVIYPTREEHEQINIAAEADHDE
jgi:hypothetical protein